MQNLIDQTNANRPGRITPSVWPRSWPKSESSSILVNSCSHWSSVQRTLFSVLSQAVTSLSVLDNIDSSSDSFPFSQAVNFLGSIWYFFERGTEFIPLRVPPYRGLIDQFPVNLNAVNIDAYFKLVSEVKINVAHTPMELTVSDR